MCAVWFVCSVNVFHRTLLVEQCTKDCGEQCAILLHHRAAAEDRLAALAVNIKAVAGFGDCNLGRDDVDVHPHGEESRSGAVAASAMRAATFEAFEDAQLQHVLMASMRDPSASAMHGMGDLEAEDLEFEAALELSRRETQTSVAGAAYAPPAAAAAAAASAAGPYPHLSHPRPRPPADVICFDDDDDDDDVAAAAAAAARGAARSIGVLPATVAVVAGHKRPAAAMASSEEPQRCEPTRVGLAPPDLESMRAARVKMFDHRTK